MADNEIIDTDELLSRLESPEPALRDIGQLLVDRAQQAFQKRRFGKVRWLTRYPGMSDPFINIAASLADLNKGQFVQRKRVDREPVLRDTRTLFRAISWRMVGKRAVAAGVFDGPAREYAFKHQHGVLDTQPVKESAKKKLAQQMKISKGTFRKALGRLGFLFNQNTLKTQIVERPFLGVTPEIAQASREIVEGYIGEARI